jgi:signal transduction histidine kinase
LYFNPVSIKFKSIEQEIDDLFNSTAAVKNISLDYFYSEEIVICADKDMLLTMRNLITNALKFTNEGGKIAVFCSKLEQIEITVSDNGIGISEDVKRKIFKIDSPVTQSGTSGEIGTGLGLILCKNLLTNTVEKYGWKVY